MFKLHSVVSVLSLPVAVLHPVTGAEVGASVTLAGPEHPKAKALEFARQRKQRATFNATGKVQLGDPEEDAEESVESLAARTLGWDGLADDDGNPLPYSPEAALALYTDPRNAWLRDQMFEALGKRERFIAASPQV